MTDLSQLSDADLKAMYAAPAAAANGVSAMSDADLKKAYAASQMGNAITDVVPEIKNAATENIDAIKAAQPFGKDPLAYINRGPIESLKATGKGLLAIPGLIASPITGASRSLIGHSMADAEHYVNSLFDPKGAQGDDRAAQYEKAKEGVDLAMSAVMPGRRAPNIKAPTIPELKKSATDVWESPAIKAIDIPPADVAALGEKIETDLAKQGFRPTAGNAPDTLAEVKALTPPSGVSAVKVDDLRSARRALSIAAGKRDPLTGVALPDANAATQAINHIDNFLDALAPELKVANADYAAAKSAERLDYRAAKAERRAAKSGTGGNLENTMRQEADKIPDRGLTPSEREARDQIVMGTRTRNALRTTGKLGVDGGLSLMLNGAAAVGSGGATLPITAGGTLARKIGELLTRREIGQLNEAIRSRSPLAQKIAAGTPVAKLSNSAKSIAALLMSPNGQGLAIPRGMPANAQQQQQ